MHAMLEGTSKVEGIQQMKGVHAYLDAKDLTQKDFIVPIGFDKLGYKEAVTLYEEAGVITYERLLSSPYLARMLESFGLTGSIRVSPMHCHSVTDIEAFLEITKMLCQQEY